MINLLEIKNVCVKYKNNIAVNDVSFPVGENEIVGIVGESGSGKTTLIRSIVNLLNEQSDIYQGQIKFEGQNLLSLSEKQMQQIRGHRIGLVFQHPELSLNPIMTIGRLCYESMHVHSNISKKEAMNAASKLLRDLSLDNPEKILSSYPFELSGGMCQRAAIAIAMVNKPKLLLADEPTSALDVMVQSQVIETMMEMKKQFNTSILIVSHNMGVITKMADKVGVMYQGSLVEWGSTNEVLKNPKHEYTRTLLRAIPKTNENIETAGVSL